MSAKTLADIRRREKLACVGLTTLWNTLDIASDNSSNDEIFDDLLLLVGTGLKVTRPDDGLVDPDILAGAITRAKAAHGKLIDDCFDDPDPARAPTRKEFAAIWIEEVNGTSLGLLRVRETDFAETCACLELPTYWWPRVKWAQRKEDLEQRPTTREYSKITRTPLCTGSEQGYLPLKEAVNLRHPSLVTESS